MLRLDGIRFTVERGRSILIEAPAGKPSNHIRLWLLGSVMAALLHQRGYLPIHANVVDAGAGRAMAFAGDSGAGKSTLAGWFDSRGHRVLADDLCAIRIAGDGSPELFEGIPRIKLWSDALARLDRSAEGLEQVASGLDKYHVPLGGQGRPGRLEPLRLERLYLLDRAGEGAPFAIDRITGAEAARGVVANAFRWHLGQRIQPERRSQFDQCVALAREVAVFRVRRRWGNAFYEADAQAIEQHMAAPLTV